MGVMVQNKVACSLRRERKIRSSNSARVKSYTYIASLCLGK